MRAQVERRHQPQVSSYLQDIEDELSPTRLEAYILELKPLVPAREFAHLEAACRHLAEAQEAVHQVACRLA